MVSSRVLKILSFIFLFLSAILVPVRIRLVKKEMKLINNYYFPSIVCRNAIRIVDLFLRRSGVEGGPP